MTECPVITYTFLRWNGRVRNGSSVCLPARTAIPMGRSSVPRRPQSCRRYIHQPRPSKSEPGVAIEITMSSDLKSAADAAFGDAWQQYDSALERLDAGDVRDACGKAWNATRAATRAAALAYGEDPQSANHISGWIRRVGRTGRDSRLCHPCTASERSSCISRAAATDLSIMRIFPTDPRYGRIHPPGGTAGLVMNRTALSLQRQPQSVSGIRQ